MEFGLELDKFKNAYKKIMISQILNEISEKCNIEITIETTSNDKQMIINLED